MKADVVIIGAGVNGNSIAYSCAKKGMKVVVIEHKDIANGTSSACDTAVNLQTKSPGIHLDMAMKSIKKLEEHSKNFEVDFHFKNTGTMLVVERPEQMDIMQSIADKQFAAGLNVRMLGKEEACQKQPCLTGGSTIAVTYCDQDATVDPQRLTMAYYVEAKKLGVEYKLYTEVKKVKMRGNEITGVITDKGDEIDCGCLVNACGVFAPLFAEAALGLFVPIAPKKGQIIVTEPVAPFTTTTINCAKYIAAKHRPDLLGDSLADHYGVGLSLTQTERGNLLLGGTRQFEGYDFSVDAVVLQLIAEHGCRIVPSLKELGVIRTFAGLRPFTPDGLPILGRTPKVKNLVMAAGHEGDGLALSAITGEMVSEIVANEPISSGVDVSRMSLERFDSIDPVAFKEKYHVA